MRAILVVLFMGLFANHVIAQGEQPILESDPITETRQENSGADDQHEPTQKQSPSRELLVAIEGITTAIHQMIAKVDEIESQGPEDHEISDLNAQESMALWAKAMFWATLGTVAVAAVGIYYVHKTLMETRRLGTIQLRSYVSIHDVEIQWHGSNAVSFVVWCVNTGQTPAKFFEIGAICEPVRRRQNRHRDIPTTLTFQAWSALAGNDKLSARITPLGCDQLNRCAFNDDELLISLRGLVRYEDIFGEVFESEFSFFAHRLQFEKKKMSAPPVRLRVYERAECQAAKSKPGSKPLEIVSTDTA